MVPIAFFASNSGPGQAVPRASTDFATSTDCNSSVVITIFRLPSFPMGIEDDYICSLLNYNNLIFVIWINYDPKNKIKYLNKNTIYHFASTKYVLINSETPVVVFAK